MTIEMYADKYIKENLNNGIVPESNVALLIGRFPFVKNGVLCASENGINYELYRGGSGWRLCRYKI